MIDMPMTPSVHGASVVTGAAYTGMVDTDRAVSSRKPHFAGGAYSRVLTAQFQTSIATGVSSEDRLTEPAGGSGGPFLCLSSATLHCGAVRHGAAWGYALSDGVSSLARTRAPNPAGPAGGAFLRSGVAAVTVHPLKSLFDCHAVERAPLQRMPERIICRACRAEQSAQAPGRQNEGDIERRSDDSHAAQHDWEDDKAPQRDHDIVADGDDEKPQHHHAEQKHHQGEDAVENRRHYAGGARMHGKAGASESPDKGGKHDARLLKLGALMGRRNSVSSCTGLRRVTPGQLGCLALLALMFAQSKAAQIFSARRNVLLLAAQIINQFQPFRFYAQFQAPFLLRLLRVHGQLRYVGFDGNVRRSRAGVNPGYPSYPVSSYTAYLTYLYGKAYHNGINNTGAHMTNPFIAALRVSDAGSDELFWITRELRRYEVAAQRFRDAGIIAYADLFDGFAEQSRLEIAALTKANQRIADLDAEITASAIAFGGPLPSREVA